MKQVQCSQHLKHKIRRLSVSHRNVTQSISWVASDTQSMKGLTPVLDLGSELNCSWETVVEVSKLSLSAQSERPMGPRFHQQRSDYRS
jgi:hypothetical protein